MKVSRLDQVIDKAANLLLAKKLDQGFFPFVLVDQIDRLLDGVASLVVDLAGIFQTFYFLPLRRQIDKDRSIQTKSRAILGG